MRIKCQHTSYRLKIKACQTKNTFPCYLLIYLLPPKKAVCRSHSGRIRETSLAIIRHLSQTAHSVICIGRTAERSGVSQPHTPRGKVTGGPRAVQPEASYRTNLEDLSARHTGETAFRAKEILQKACFSAQAPICRDPAPTWVRVRTLSGLLMAPQNGWSS